MVGVADLLKSLVGEGCIVKMPLDNYKYGATIIPEEDYMKTTPVRYATVTDTNGYTVELVEAPPVNAGAVATGWVNRLILYVEDLEESIDFYTKVLGMTLYRKRSNVNSTPKDASFIAHVVSSARIVVHLPTMSWRLRASRRTHPYRATATRKRACASSSNTAMRRTR